MNPVTILAFCFVFIALASARPEGEDAEAYGTEYDQVNIDEILESERLRTNYYNCLRTGKKCTPDGKKLREILPDALKSECKKCSDFHKERANYVLKYVVKNNPEEFLVLETLFDPEHVYRTKFADKFKEEGLTLPELKAA